MIDVLRIPLGLVNAYLLVGERCVLVDSGYPGMEDRILAALAGMGIVPASLSLLVVTHGHADHFGSAAALRKRLGIPVACMDKAVSDLRDGVNRHLKPLGLSGAVASLAVSLAPASAYRAAALDPDVIFSGPAELSQWGVDAAAVPTPGHTPGSLSIIPGASRAALWGSGGPAALPWAVVGDLAFGRFTAPRRARLPIFASDTEALGRSLRLLSGSAVVYPGHGGPLEGPELAILARGFAPEGAERTS